MSGGGRMLAVLALLAVVAGGVLFFRCEGSAPAVAVDPVRIGKDPTRIELRVSEEGSGLRSVEALVRHEDGEAVVLRRRFPGDLLRGGRAGLLGEIIEVPVDAEELDLREGDAALVVRARDWSWRDFLRGNETLVEVPAVVDLQSPRVSIANGLTYVKRGGSSTVVYQVNEATHRDGVLVGDHFYPGYPWPAAAGHGEVDRSAGGRAAVFAVPDDAPENVSIRVLAEDRVGNTTRAGWATRLQERSFREDKIRLPDSFLQNKIPPLAEATNVRASDPLAAFQEVNTRVRADNEARIRDIVRGTAPDRLWKGSFVQMRNSAVTSRFAERRTYWHDGEQVSKATHYGYDLAATAGAKIAAANSGMVLFADDLGIYGNCVIVDHGLGVATLYGHLSRIDVATGDTVVRGQTLGASGQTGLAGGDHLHFAVLVGDTYVDPVEWWDRKWVADHVTARLFPPSKKAAGSD